MPRNPFAEKTKPPSPAVLAAAERAALPKSSFHPARAIAGLTGLPAGERLVLPWPPKQLNPNARMHDAQKARFKKAYRQECWALTLEAFGCTAGARLFPGDGKIAVRLDFFPPDGRARDDDNCEAAFKAGRDGVAEALKIDDRRFVVTRCLRPEVRGCIVLTFTNGDVQ